MATERQIMANRDNAKKSTGPRTLAGKRAASRNALRHGLLAAGPVLEWEDQSRFDELKERLFAALRPEGQVELVLVARAVTLVWRLRRVAEMEPEMMEYQMATLCELIRRRSQGAEPTLGAVFAVECSSGDAYSKLRRYEGQIDRALYRTLHELERRQMARRGHNVPAPHVVEVNVNAPAEAERKAA